MKLGNWPWKYDKPIRPDAPSMYGSDESYRRAAQFLDHGPVEDWGCATAYAKRFFTHPYKGVDGAPGYADIVADLREYTSITYGILLRHVLEHNYDWRLILDNALKSAERMCIVLFTPLSNETHVMAINSAFQNVPDISFKLTDITDGLTVEVEHIRSDTQYGGETLIYVAR